MNFSAPADSVAYEEEPNAAAQLLRDSNYSAYVLKRRQNYNVHANPSSAAAFVPSCWLQMESRTTLPIGGVISGGFQGSGGTAAIIFLHERVSPAGHRRLVCVNYAPETDSFQPAFIAGYDFDTCAIIPATFTRGITVAPQFYAIDVLSGYPRHPPLVRVYAGQPDPNDTAHFTIRYQIWGQEDVLDGKLQDDDQVRLTPRHSPDWPRN